MSKVKGAISDLEDDGSPPESKTPQEQLADQIAGSALTNVGDADKIEDSPLFDVKRVLYIAWLTSGVEGFYPNEANVNNITNALPPCDDNSNEFVQILSDLATANYDYSKGPVNDIKIVLRQLASCKAARQESFMTKVGAFFRGVNTGDTLRKLLLLSETMVELLAFWYILMDRGEIKGDFGTPETPGSRGAAAEMQLFSQQAISARIIEKLPPSSYPSLFRDRVIPAQSWSGNLSTLRSTFSLSGSPDDMALPLLSCSTTALNEVLKMTGKLPRQSPALGPKVSSLNPTTSTQESEDDQEDDNTDRTGNASKVFGKGEVPVAIVKGGQIPALVEEFNKSGPA